MIASADLSTPRGRDKALSEARPIVDTVPPNTATRDELMRYVADRLDVDRNYLMTQSSAPQPHSRERRRTCTGTPRAACGPRSTPWPARSARSSSMCLRLGARPRVPRAAATPSTSPTRLCGGVRDHLLAHWDDPLMGLPEDDESFAVLIKDVALRADNDDVSADVLRLTFLQLELRRVERGLRHAEQDRDFDAQRALAARAAGAARPNRRADGVDALNRAEQQFPDEGQDENEGRGAAPVSATSSTRAVSSPPASPRPSPRAAPTTRCARTSSGSARCAS